ncbi:cyclic nucleotide-binding domain-containing protein [Heliobacterium gestii]|uniref:Cyclic nucleotide-binding domain-containing protein n=1 Tax=Heliomicrobium gestii TaxID=2699 RepID=A0A845LBV6_HELGE|nr:SLC13 family permease [Heliomicrobium gestii]MBM7867393.1 anion transporter [Heliomicrobium gestii]MZP43658.1 cyclic nucleotide-binding domain-containing protein [Heliomicrobium gestii]
MDVDLRLLEMPIFSGLDRVHRAKLLPEFEEIRFPAGQIIFHEGDRGDSLYIIISGSVVVYREPAPGQGPRILARYDANDCFGETALLAGDPRTATAKTLTPCRMARLSKERFDDLVNHHHRVAIDFARLLSKRLAIYSGHNRKLHDVIAATDIDLDDFPEAAVTSRWRLFAMLPLPSGAGGAAWLGWLKEAKPFWLLSSTALLMTLLYCLLQSAGMQAAHIALLLIITAAALFWAYDFFSPHAIALCLPLAAVLVHATKPAVAFSGFSHSSWFLILGVSALTAGISRTGLMYRLALLVMKRFPPNYGGQALAWALTGALLTPVIPSSNARVSLMTPMLLALGETLRLPGCGNATAGLAMSCLLGFGHMSFLFLNGAAVCYLILGLIPHADAQWISYQTWLIDAAPLGLTFFILSFAAILLLFPHKEPLQIQPEMIDAQLTVLGPLTREEKVCLLATSFSLIGFLTQTWHQIDSAWVALTSFLILYAGSVLNDKSIRSGIDWGFLITFGSMLGFGNAMKDTGLTDTLSHMLQPLLAMVMGNQIAFLFAVALYIYLLRFVLPITPALLVGMLTVTPLCGAMHIHPIVVGLILLLTSNAWVLPNQNAMYFSMLDGTDDRLFKHEQTRVLSMLYGLICLIAIGVSVPYWEMVGLIY